MDHDLAVWVNTKSCHRWCYLRPCPCVVWWPPGFRIRAYSLFLIFINDLPDNVNSTVRLFADDCVLCRNIRNSTARLFADYCVLYRNIRRSEDQQILQDDLNKLAQWEETWLMKFDVAKCHSLSVTKHPLPKQIIHDYALHNPVLENVPSAKYLGITVTDDLDWSQHINNVTSKATKTLGFIRRNLTLATKETKVAAYKALVRPQLEYAEPIWNSHHRTEINIIEKVQRTVAGWVCRRWCNQSHIGEMLEELQSKI